MYQKNLVYDKKRDIQEVDQFGFVDLVKSFQNGYVQPDLQVDANGFNNIDDPSTILGRPHDAFEAMRMQDLIVANAKDRVAKAKAAKPSSTDEN